MSYDILSWLIWSMAWEAFRIVGVLGPESSIVCYCSIIAACRQQKQGHSQPAILINSIDLTKMPGPISANLLPEVAEYLVKEVQTLA